MAITFTQIHLILNQDISEESSNIIDELLGVSKKYAKKQMQNGTTEVQFHLASFKYADEIMNLIVRMHELNEIDESQYIKLSDQINKFKSLYLK